MSSSGHARAGASRSHDFAGAAGALLAIGYGVLALGIISAVLARRDVTS